MSYAGDITCKDCWSVLNQKSDAQLVDVRTSEEWKTIGVPDLSSIGKQVLLAEWQQFPTMQINTLFAEQVSDLLGDAGTSGRSSVLLICRSGARSISAAEALTKAGYECAFNVLEGFEGRPNNNGRRGTVSGWKFDSLPWRQS